MADVIHLRRALLVAVGGAIGTAGRLGIGLLLPDAGGFPISIITVNVLGAFLIGLLAARLPSSSERRIFLATGVLGGFTTYSTFAVGTVQLWGQSPMLAAISALLTLVVGLAAAAAGLRIGMPRRSA